MELRLKIYVIIFPVFFLSCNNIADKNVTIINNQVIIDPDYSGVTIPYNIAPLNFLIEEEGDTYFVKLSTGKGKTIKIFSKNGIIKFPVQKWGKLLSENKNGKLNYEVFVKKNDKWKKFRGFTNTISETAIDTFLYYRLLYPGYESWLEISIMQRNLQSFKEKAVIKNNVVDRNCINCHSFNQQNSDNFLFHIRGSFGGTYFVNEDKLQKFNLKTEEMEYGAVYPRWHPSGKFVAFSSNKVVQRFHSAKPKKIEVSDLASSLVLYDVEKNEMMEVDFPKKNQFMDTYPEWSPDGKYLYFCRADQIGEEYDYQDIKYNLYRVSFDLSSRNFGEAELIFDAAASNKSVSFPRVSPNGKLLVFTYHNYGCFPIWHKEADLYSIDLDSFSVKPLNVNSDFTDSYHSWSRNGKWLVFSSKRGDGLTARPFISFIANNGKAQKPFVLPQEDPGFYSRFIKTFNIPELTNADFTFTPGEIKIVAKNKATQANWAEN